MERQLKTKMVSYKEIYQEVYLKKELFKQKSPLKIKILKAAIDGEKNSHYYANEVTKVVHAKLVGVRGNTFVIAK